MVDTEKEMQELLKLNVDYPNFQTKCNDFEKLCTDIHDIVGIAIDNLQHFTTEEYSNNLKEEHNRAVSLFRSYSIIEGITDSLDFLKPKHIGMSFVDGDSFKLDEDEFEEFKSKEEALFSSIIVEENKHEIDDSLQANEGTEKQTNEKDMLDEDASKNLNDLVMKRMDKLMDRAINRKPLEGTEHEQRVKDIREGKFKI